jgi:uncharacterized protein YhfF
MPIPPHLIPYWSAFERLKGTDVSARFYEASYFGDSEAMADELARHAITGTKRGTTSLAWAIEFDGKKLPAPRDLTIVTDWKGKPQCIIETTVVEMVAFEAVTEQFAAIEGEGDGSLGHWQEVHWAYFGRECRRVGKIATPWMPVVCEQFAVVYPGR